MRKTKIVCTLGPASDSAEMMKKLDKYGYEGALTLEVWQRDAYADMTPEAFAAHIYSLAQRVANAHH